MIKFTATSKNGGKLIGIGLSEGNIAKLKEGKPIHFKLSDLGLPWDGEVLIMYGKTEEAMGKELADAGLIPAIKVGEGKIEYDLQERWPSKRHKK